MRATLAVTMLACTCGLALAKLPAPNLDDAAKAKAAEAAAKAAWQGKVDAWQLCKAQDKVAAHYLKSTKSAGGGAPATPPCVDPGPFAYNPAGAAPAAAPAAPAAKAAAAPMAKKP
jgi:hypothetical protein